MLYQKGDDVMNIEQIRLKFKLRQQNLLNEMLAAKKKYDENRILNAKYIPRVNKLSPIS